MSEKDDDELMARLRASEPMPAVDPRFWVDFRAGIAERLAQPSPVKRRSRFAVAVTAVGFAAAAALAIAWWKPFQHAPHVVAGRIAEEELLFEEDATELVGHLDSDELKAVDLHLKTGV